MSPAEIQARVGAAYQAFTRGDLASATAALESVLVAAPQDANALHLLAGVKRQAGDRVGALALFDRAIALAPQAAPLHFNRGNVLLELGQHAAALDAYDVALSLRRDHAESHLNRGRTLSALGKQDDALAAFDAAATLGPRTAPLWNARGIALAAIGRHSEAAQSFAESLKLAPRDVDALFNRARSLHALDRLDDAIAGYEAVLSIAPNAAGAWDNRGMALHDLDRIDEALESLEAARRLRPNHADTHSNLGLVLFAAKRPDEAVDSFDRALALTSSDDEARRSAIHYNRGMAFLARHDLTSGWDGFEARWASQMVDTPHLDRGEPQWRGEHVHGTLRVWREQGIGDEILFARLLPLAKARADRLALQCEPRLVPLFARAFPGIEVTSSAETDVPPATAQCGLGGLGAALNVSEADLCGAAFLKADIDRQQVLRAKYEHIAQGRPIIGIAWTSKSPQRGAYKSAALTHWRPLLTRDALFVSLQYHADETEIAEARAAFGTDILIDADIDQMRDLDGFAAQIASLDHVVSVSNTTVHLAGALGVPCIVMPPPARGRLWYWGLEGEATPWYFSVRILRRDVAETREAQIARAAAMLF